MKDIIIVDKEKVIAFKPKELDIYSQEYIEEIDIIENTKKVEQVPETFEELKELCKNLDYIRFGKAGETQDTEYIALDNKLYFYKNGTIDFGFDNLAYDITFAKMWTIIKSLL